MGIAMDTHGCLHGVDTTDVRQLVLCQVECLLAASLVDAWEMGLHPRDPRLIP